MTTKFFFNARQVKLSLFAVVLFSCSQLRATDATLTITRSDVTTQSLAYGTDADWTVGTISGKCQVTANNSELQFNGGKPNGTEGTGAGQVIKSRRCWNTTSMPGKIKSITITSSSSNGTARAWRVFCGTSAATNSSTTSYGTEFGSSATASTSGTTWSVPNNDDTDYRYFMAYENETSAAYITSIVVTYEAAPAVTYSVVWKSDGTIVHTDASVASGTTVSTPSNPSVPSGCTGSAFMGWTATENYSANTAPGDMFNGTSPAITAATTFYAVFADPD